MVNEHGIQRANPCDGHISTRWKCLVGEVTENPERGTTTVRPGPRGRQRPRFLRFLCLLSSFFFFFFWWIEYFLLFSFAFFNTFLYYYLAVTLELTMHTLHLLHFILTKLLKQYKELQAFNSIFMFLPFSLLFLYIFVLTFLRTL